MEISSHSLHLSWRSNGESHDPERGSPSSAAMGHSPWPPPRRFTTINLQCWLLSGKWSLIRGLPRRNSKVAPNFNINVLHNYLWPRSGDCSISSLCPLCSWRCSSLCSQSFLRTLFLCLCYFVCLTYLITFNVLTVIVHPVQALSFISSCLFHINSIIG